LFCSVIVLNAFAKEYKPESQTPWEAGTKYDDGIIILEALSATGLRSIRYAKEVKGVKEIVANDISVKAVDDIKRNISANGVEDLVTASHDDATCVWMNHKNKIVIVIFQDVDVHVSQGATFRRDRFRSLRFSIDFFGLCGSNGQRRGFTVGHVNRHGSASR
jgi:tRNA G26 N,N-dimethylase Trm1